MPTNSMEEIWSRKNWELDLILLILMRKSDARKDMATVHHVSVQLMA